MSQMRDATPSNRSPVQHSQGSSLASLVVTVGVTCSSPLGADEHGTRGTEDLLVSSLGQHRGGIVIVVGQDEYDAIDAADQVTPELITSQPAGLGKLWRRSISQSVRQSVSGRPCFPGCLACAFWLSGSRGLSQAPASFVSTGREAGKSQKRLYHGQRAKIS